MIQANELRIGNIISHIERTSFYTEENDNVFLSDIIILDEDKLEVLFASRDYHNYKGVPLTEEWLLKLGFKKGERHLFISIDSKSELFFDGRLILDVELRFNGGRTCN